MDDILEDADMSLTPDFRSRLTRPAGKRFREEFPRLTKIETAHRICEPPPFLPVPLG
jgi:hypothetical protein